MIVVGYKSKTDLELHIGERLQGASRDPNAKIQVTGPSLLDRRFKAQVQLRDGKIYSVR